MSKLISTDAAHPVTRVQVTRQGDDAPHVRSARPAPRPRTIRDDVNEQLSEWLDGFTDDESGRIVARFRL